MSNDREQWHGTSNGWLVGPPLAAYAITPEREQQIEALEDALGEVVGVKHAQLRRHYATALLDGPVAAMLSRIDALMRTLVESGDATPEAARQVRELTGGAK